MLKIKNVEKLLIVVLVVMMILVMQIPVNASSPIIVNNTLTPIPTIGNSTGNNTAGSGTTSNNTVNNTNNSQYTNSNLPQAGIDYSVLFVIVACVISGVYAYIKIRDYNNINY